MATTSSPPGPQADPDQGMHGVRLIPLDDLPRADAVVARVAHRKFAELVHQDLRKELVTGGSFVDVKAMFDPRVLKAAGSRVWRL